RVAVGDTAHLAELLHEVGLRVEAPGRVGEHEVDAAGGGPLDGVEDHRARVAALGAADDVGAAALGPGLELLGGRGPERVAGGHHDRATALHLLATHLADRRRLAHAVDA